MIHFGIGVRPLRSQIVNKKAENDTFVKLCQTFLHTKTYRYINASSTRSAFWNKHHTGQFMQRPVQVYVRIRTNVIWSINKGDKYLAGVFPTQHAKSLRWLAFWSEKVLRNLHLVTFICRRENLHLYIRFYSSTRLKYIIRESSRRTLHKTIRPFACWH